MIWAKLHEHDSFISSIKGLLFFGVPNEGMDIQSLRQIVRGQPNEELLKSLEKGSRELRYRSQTYSYFFKNYLDPPVAFFYENKLSNTAIQVSQFAILPPVVHYLNVIRLDQECGNWMGH